jgi:hypothetical protein
MVSVDRSASDVVPGGADGVDGADSFGQQQELLWLETRRRGELGSRGRGCLAWRMTEGRDSSSHESSGIATSSKRAAQQAAARDVVAGHTGQPWLDGKL